MECAADTQGLTCIKASQVPADQVIHMDLYGYVVSFGEVSGDLGVAQTFRRHILQMNRAIDPPRLLSIDEFYSTPDQHFLEIQARLRHVDHHGHAWSHSKIPILIFMARRGNTDVVTNSQELHGQAPV
jgi:hypothetical protein